MYISPSSLEQSLSDELSPVSPLSDWVPELDGMDNGDVLNIAIEQYRNDISNIINIIEKEQSIKITGRELSETKKSRYPFLKTFKSFFDKGNHHTSVYSRNTRFKYDKIHNEEIKDIILYMIQMSQYKKIPEQLYRIQDISIHDKLNDVLHLIHFLQTELQYYIIKYYQGYPEYENYLCATFRKIKKIGNDYFLLFDVPGDGDCLFTSIGQLVQRSSYTMRDIICSYLENNEYYFRPFFDESNYIERMRTPGVYGGNPELVALSKFGYNIRVYDKEHKKFIHFDNNQNDPYLYLHFYKNHYQPMIFLPV